MLEKKFGKPHPKLAEFKEPFKAHLWLPQAFFRLHRRRQFGQHGYQPLGYQEMADFARHVLRLEHPDQLDLYYLTIEETDNAVLYDQAMKSQAKYDEAQAEAAARGKKGKKTPR